MIRLLLFFVLAIATLSGARAAGGDPWLGVTVAPLPQAELERLGLDHGLRLTGVEPGGPADEAGLREGDVALAAAGRPLSSVARLQWIVHDHRPGDTLPIDYLRDGERATARVVLGSWQERAWSWHGEPPFHGHHSYLGLRLEPMTPALRRHFGAPAERGLLVSEVVAGSPADRAGVRVGDVVVRMDRRALRSLADVRRVLDFFEPGERIELELVRDGDTLVRQVELGSRRHGAIAPPPFVPPPLPPPLYPHGAPPGFDHL